MTRRAAAWLFGGWAKFFRDLTRAMDLVLVAGRPVWRSAPLPFISTVAAWWLYVPIHELLHVAGCLVVGGTVTELQLSPLYGGTLLSRWLPFVTPGQGYAGRLTGFDTGGSDVRLILIDLAPCLLTVVVGVPLLVAIASGRLPARRAALLFGPAVVLSAAPFLSVAGDGYEIASVLVTALLTDRWLAIRTDDLVGLLRPGGLPGEVATAAGFALIAASAVVSAVISGWIYRAGAVFGRRFAVR